LIDGKSPGLTAGALSSPVNKLAAKVNAIRAEGAKF
jgi:hypothetical protein